MVLSHLNEIETKLKEYYKEKSSNFIIALELNNDYVDRKWRFKDVWMLQI